MYGDMGPRPRCELSILVVLLVLPLIFIASCGGNQSTTSPQAEPQLLVGSAYAPEINVLDIESGSLRAKIPLPWAVNSMVQAPLGSKIFLGTDHGLIVLDRITLEVEPIRDSLPGMVLGVSPDGSRLVISDIPQAAFRIVTLPNYSTNLYSGTVWGSRFSADGASVAMAGTSTLFVFDNSLGMSRVEVSSGAIDVTYANRDRVLFVAGGNTTAWSGCDLSRLESLDFSSKKIIASNDSTHLIAAGGGPGLWWAVIPSSTTGDCPTSLTAPLSSVPLTSADVQITGVKRDNSETFYATYFSDPLGPFASEIGLPFYSLSTRSAGTVPLAGNPNSVLDVSESKSKLFLYAATTGDNAIHVIDAGLKKDIRQIPTRLELRGVVVSPSFVLER
jgi:trimeric autotransporter adhesin